MIQSKIEQGGKTFRLKYIYQNKPRWFPEFMLDDMYDLGRAGYPLATRRYDDTTALYIGRKHKA